MRYFMICLCLLTFVVFLYWLFHSLLGSGAAADESKESEDNNNGTYVAKTRIRACDVASTDDPLRQKTHIYVVVIRRLRRAVYVNSWRYVCVTTHTWLAIDDYVHYASIVTALEPRTVIRRGTIFCEKFCEHWADNLPDMSDRPEIPPEKVQFWMMDDKGRHSKGRRSRQRFPAAHSRLKGLRGQSFNEALDFAISCNKWCVSFKDEDGVIINLVDNCIVYAWLKYISRMVRTKFHVYVITNTYMYIIWTRIRHFTTHIRIPYDTYTYTV